MKAPLPAAARLPSPARGRGSHLQPSPRAGEGAARSAAGEGTLRKRAKDMRSHMTDAEMKLWQALRAKRFEGYKFKRQVPIGNYIVDFACLSHRLVIEVDGSQHDDNDYDRRRDAWLQAQGFTVQRFWNIDILQAMDGTLIRILDTLRNSPLPAAARPPSPARGEG